MMYSLVGDICMNTSTTVCSASRADGTLSISSRLDAILYIEGIMKGDSAAIRDEA